MSHICMLGLILVLGTAVAAEEALDPRAQRILDSYQQDLATAAERYHKTVAEARAAAVTGLKRQIRSLSPVPERVRLMREVLRIDRADPEATAFFAAIGTLDAELAGLGEPADAALTVDLLASGPAVAGPELLRQLVVSSPAAEALAAAYQAEPKAPLHAAFAGFGEDQVGSGPSGAPNGRPDGRIDILVVAEIGTIVRIDVQASGTWTSAPGAHWILGVVANQERINPQQVKPLYTPTGATLLSCYADDALPRWQPGSTVAVTVILADGSQHALRVGIPATKVEAAAGAGASKRRR